MSQERNGDRATSRRNIIAIGAAGLVGLAGCTEDSDPESNDTSNGDSTSGGNGDSAADGGQDWPEWPEDPADRPQPGDGEEYVNMFPQPAERLYELQEFNAHADQLREQLENPRDEPRYGDPVWEMDDSEEFIAPDPLIFTFVPDDEPQVFIDAFDEYMDNIEAETGHAVEYRPVDSYSAQVEAMRSERLHVARISSGILPFAVNLAGAQPFAHILAGERYGNAFWMITRKDNDEINRITDLKGKLVHHADPGSGSGNLEPRVFIQEDTDLVPEEDYDIEFSGAHDTSAIGIERGDFEVGPVGGPTFERLARNEQIDAENFKVIYMGPVFPRGPFSYIYNLDPELKEGIERATFEYDYEGSVMEDELRYNNFAPVDYATTYDPTLTVHQQLGIEYTEEEI